MLNSRCGNDLNSYLIFLLFLNRRTEISWLPLVSMQIFANHLVIYSDNYCSFPGSAHAIWYAWCTVQAGLVLCRQWQLHPSLWPSIVSISVLDYLIFLIWETPDFHRYRENDFLVFNCLFFPPYLLLYRFSEKGKIFAKEEVRSIQVGPGGLFFTGDGTGELKVWKWVINEVASS